MHGPINVKSPNNISKWQMVFKLAFKELKYIANPLKFVLYRKVLVLRFENCRKPIKQDVGEVNILLIKGGRKYSNHCVLEG
jgi:hypothetical protein